MRHHPSRPRVNGHVTAWDVRLPAATHGCRAQAPDWPRQSSSSKLYLCPRSGIRPSIARRQCRSCGSEPLRAHCSASSPASERCTSQSAVYSFGTLRVRCATHASRSAPRRAEEGGLMSALRTRVAGVRRCAEARRRAWRRAWRRARRRRGAGEAGGGGGRQHGAVSGWPAQLASHVIEGWPQLAHAELLAPCCGVEEELVAQHAAHQLVLLPALDE